MAVSKITTSEDIEPCFAYDVRSKNANDPPGLWICGTVCGTVSEMAKQTAVFRQLRPDCRRPIVSFSISLPPADGRPSNEKWKLIVERFLTKMGVDIKTHAWACHLHVHKNSHTHIRLCRVGGDGVLWNQEHSAKRAIKACEELEEEFCLEKHDRTPSNKKRPTMAETQMSKRKGQQMPIRLFMQTKVDIAIQNHPNGIDFKDLQKLLAVDNIDIRAYAPNGLLKGVSYLYDGLKWPGSKLGSHYSSGLSDRGVSYTGETAAQQIVQTHSPARNSKMPAVIKTLLPVQYANKGIVSHASHKTEDYSSNTDLPPRILLEPKELSEMVLLVGSLLMTCAVSLLRAVLNFMKKILSLFGYSMKHTANQPFRHISGQALSFEPTVDSQLSIPAATAEAQAAEALTSLATAIQCNSHANLPLVSGAEKERNCVLEAMANSSGIASSATVIDIDKPKDTEFGISADELQSLPKPSEPTLVDLKAAGEAQVSAHQALAWASNKEEFEDGTLFYAKILAEANDKLRDAENSWEHLKKCHPIASRVYESPEKKALESAQFEVESAKYKLNVAQKEMESLKKVHDETPLPKPSQYIVTKAKTVALEFNKISAMMLLEQRKRIQSITDSALQSKLLVNWSDARAYLASVEREGRSDALTNGTRVMVEIDQRIEAERRRNEALMREVLDQANEDRRLDEDSQRG